MNRKLLCVFGLLVLFELPALAQSKLRFGVDYQYHFGVNQRILGKNITRGSLAMNGHSIQPKLMYHLVPQVKLGAGIALGGYDNPKFPSIPVFAEVQYHPTMDVPDLFAFGSVGYGIVSDQEDGYGRLTSSLGVGYFVGKRLNFKVGYHYQEAERLPVSNTEVIGGGLGVKISRTHHTLHRHSVLLGIGWLF